MIQKESRLIVGDNSGAKIVRCIRGNRKSEGRALKLGERIKVVVKKIYKKKKAIKGMMYDAILIRSKKINRNRQGITFKSDSNTVILFNKLDKPLGNRIKGPLSMGLRKHRLLRFYSLLSFDQDRLY